ncbi:hypothetical protein [Streptomyces apricus]|uniref:Uncharacterized protein n=1 Tax=Streptomyces apricus TaxID=1828112 RepID=A0A5B0A3G1_9ACTN|nr:hypothetical protein [Streptomyces apricus]KAA0924114.1 hypothetical protein FGF04_33285 [Streptomyces apricus]
MTATGITGAVVWSGKGEGGPVTADATQPSRFNPVWRISVNREKTENRPLEPGSAQLPKKQFKVHRRAAMFLAVLGTAAGLIASTTTPAAADSGRNNNLWIRAVDGQIQSEHYPGSPLFPPNGTYHIHYWKAGGGWDVNGRNYHFPGQTVFGRIAAPVAAGSTVCAELFYHKPEGGYGSYGLPCVRMS